MNSKIIKRMGGNAEYICRFCLKICHDFECVTESHYEALQLLSLTLDLAVSHDPVICNICAVNLKNCLDYKTTCLELKDIVQKIVGFCLLCKKQQIDIRKFIRLNSDQIDILLLRAMMEQYFPELNLQANANVVIICSLCYESLQKNFDFIINCLSVEQLIIKCRETLGTNSKGQIELRNIMNLTIDRKIAKEDSKNINGCCDYKIDDNKDEKLIPVFVKEENNWGKAEDSNMFDDTINLENCEEIDKKLMNQIKIEETWIEDNVVLVKAKKPNDTEDTIAESTEDMTQKLTFYNEDTTVRVPMVKSSDKPSCDYIEGKSSMQFEMKNTNNLKKNDDRVKVAKKRKINNNLKISSFNNKWWTIGSNVSMQSQIYFSKSELRAMITPIYIAGEKKYQCQVCQFVATAKCSVSRHVMRHQDPSELNIYNCNDCKYKTTTKASLASHMKCHRDLSLVPLRQCPYCHFRARNKKTMRVHLVKHKNCPNVTVFECFTCGYKTFHKTSLRYHVFTHRRPQPLPNIYNCDRCNFGTRRKPSLDSHLISHSNPLMIPKLKCDVCNYKCKYSSALVRHKQSHGEPVKCKYCHFKSKYSWVFNKHLRKSHNIHISKSLEAAKDDGPC